jgi:hypothetical protein
MNNIEIIKISATNENTTESIVEFGIILNKFSTFIKISHWFIQNYNMHVLLGELYSDLDELFDSLQEEIIGTSKKYGVLFPKFNKALFQVENFEDYNSDDNILNKLYLYLDDLKNILTSLEFSDYITKVKSGIGNTKEEIISRVNKFIYLSSMINLK